MTTIGMHYEVKPGKEDEFEQGFLGVLNLLKTLPGHVESHMYEDIESKGSYVILSQWESKEAYGKFLNSPEFAKAVAWGKAEILRSRPKHKVFNED
jgi:heme-degrading monooxygenase HmoA